MMVWWWGVLLLVLALLALPLILERHRLQMNSTTRRNAPGRFAELTQGLTHYQWHGPARGPVMVCVHGLTTPGYVWDALIRRFTMMGFRVLTYDLYGRGYSDRPPGRQDCEFFLMQLEDLLRDQGIKEGIELVGYSMGGTIATCYAARHPDTLDRLILLAPTGLSYRPGSLARFMIRTPLIGDWLMIVFGGWLIRRGILAESETPSEVPDIYERQARETRYRGFLPAVLSSMRHILGKDTSAEHRKIAGTTVPVLAIWAEKDNVIGLEGMGKLAELNRRARQAEVPGAGHSMAYTNPDIVIRAMQQFMREV